jgi:hypothetical protein
MPIEEAHKWKKYTIDRIWTELACCKDICCVMKFTYRDRLLKLEDVLGHFTINSINVSVTTILNNH